MKPAFLGTAISKIYQTGETEVHALRGVDIEIPAGEVLVLLGPSGSGKSTLLNILGGLDRPTSGKLCYGDLDLTEIDETELTRFRRAEVGFIVRRQNIWLNWRRKLAECGLRLRVDIMRRSCGVASADARWSVV